MSNTLCLRGGWGTALLALVLGSNACGGVDGGEVLFEPGVGAAGPRPQAYLEFPPDVYQAPRAEEEIQPNFPRLLSQTGAFSDVSALQPAPGLVPYDLQVPLWSDGAFKQRWISLPELGAVRAPDEAAWQVPEGTILVKHFELALDESQPEVRRRLETRLLIAARGGAFYGVTYKWNETQTDAELVLQGETEPLSIRGADGVERQQPYFYPGPRDCSTCHTAASGYVLGLRTRQLNRELSYSSDFPAVNQLVAWGGWGFFADRSFDNTATMLAPQLASLSDESADLEQRVRSYWDGNCSMCHAGKEGTVNGWDARFLTPIEQQGLDQPPRGASPSLPSRLIVPGHPDDSYIYVRGDTVDGSLRMPPIGRNRVDENYISVLRAWIESLPR